MELVKNAFKYTYVKYLDPFFCDTICIAQNETSKIIGTKPVNLFIYAIYIFTNILSVPLFFLKVHVAQD